MKRLACYLVSIVLFFTIGVVRADDFVSGSTSSARKECLELARERNAALTVDDWPALVGIVRRFIQSCTGVYSRREIANAYGTSADANYRMARFGEALIQANAGIATHYLEPSNHLQKVKSLVALGNVNDAKDAFRVADQVIHMVIEEHNADRLSAIRDQELYELTRVSYEVTLAALEKYRHLLGQQ